MSSYKVKLVSQTNATVFIISAVVISLVSSAIFLPSGGLQNVTLAILAVSAWGLIAYILWQIIVTGRTIWAIDENKIKIVWTKKFILSESEDIVINWNEIKGISKGPDPQYYNLKMELVAGYSLEYFYDNGTTSDDFQEMLKMLYQTFNEKKKYSLHLKPNTEL